MKVEISWDSRTADDLKKKINFGEFRSSKYVLSSIFWCCHKSLVAKHGEKDNNGVSFGIQPHHAQQILGISSTSPLEIGNFVENEIQQQGNIEVL